MPDRRGKDRAARRAGGRAVLHCGGAAAHDRRASASWTSSSAAQGGRHANPVSVLGCSSFGALGVNTASGRTAACGGRSSHDGSTSTVARTPGSAAMPPGLDGRGPAGRSLQRRPVRRPRSRFPPAQSVAPHWHPTDENLTVLKGTLQMGMGEKFDARPTQDAERRGLSSWRQRRRRTSSSRRRRRLSSCTGSARSRSRT